MLSILRPSLVYTVNIDVADHDDDVDAEEWSYNGLNMYRGTLDVSFRDYELDVFWLYSDVSECIGLAEHDSSDHSIFSVLLYKDSSFGTLFQEDWTNQGAIWSRLSAEAYQDFLDCSIEELVLASNGRLISLNMMLNKNCVYECLKCNKKSFNEFTCKEVKKKPFGPFLDPLFIDDSYVIHKPPPNSKVWSFIQLADASLNSEELMQKSLRLSEHPENCAELPQEAQHQLQTVHSLQSDEQQPPLPLQI